jgi:excisionase family DNA binding protein
MNDTTSRKERLRAFVLALADLLEPDLRAEGLWPSQSRVNPPPPPAPMPVPQQEDDHLWDADEVARFLNLSASWVYKRSAEGVLPSVRLGSALRFIPEDVAAWAGIIPPKRPEPPSGRPRAGQHVAQTSGREPAAHVPPPAQKVFSPRPSAPAPAPAPPSAPTLPAANALLRPYGSGLSPRQAAAQLGVCRATVYKLCETQELPHWREGNNAIQIDPVELARFAEKNRASAKKTGQP